MCSLWNTTPSDRAWQRQFICKQIYCLSAHVKQPSLGQNKSNIIKRSHSNITTYHKCFSYLKRALATRDSHHQYQIYNINRQANPSEESSCRRNQHAPWPHHSNNTKHTHTHDMTWTLESNEKITRMMKPRVNPKCARTRTKRTKITPPTSSKPYAFCLDLAKRGS